MTVIDDVRTATTQDGADAAAPAPSGPAYRVSSYLVSPAGFDRVAGEDRRRWCLTVMDCGDGWAIRWRNQCLNFRNEWELNVPPELRSDEFLLRCRFNEHAALLRARKFIVDFVVDGMTFDEYVADVRGEATRAARETLRLERRLSLFKQWMARRDPQPSRA